LYIYWFGAPQRGHLVVLGTTEFSDLRFTGLNVLKERSNGVKKIRKAIGKQLSYIKRDLKYIFKMINFRKKLNVVNGYTRIEKLFL
jgi:hypothetical protein